MIALMETELTFDLLLARLAECPTDELAVARNVLLSGEIDIARLSEVSGWNYLEREIVEPGRWPIEGLRWNAVIFWREQEAA